MVKKFHELKTNPEVFEDKLNGLKPWEWRKNDRDFQLGDVLIQWEYFKDNDWYSGRFIMEEIVYIFQGGVFDIPEDYVIMTLHPWHKARNISGQVPYPVHTEKPASIFFPPQSLKKNSTVDPETSSQAPPMTFTDSPLHLFG